MKNKIIKGSFAVITVIVITVLMFLQLENNKAEINQVKELAKITGRFFPVKTEKVSLKSIREEVLSNGFLRPFTDLYVISETQGRLISIYKEKGDFVKKGDVIAEVDSELLTAQLDATTAAIEQLKKDEARFLSLEAQNAVTRRDLETIQLNLKTNCAKLITAKRQLADTKIKAPISGLINDDFIEPAQFIGAGSKICNIIDINKLKLTIKIPETDLKYTKSGQSAIITSSIFPNEKFNGKVISIADKAGMGNTFDVDIILNNSNKSRLKAGQYVNVCLTQNEAIQKIYIPRKSINGSLKDATIYVVKNDKAILKNITTGNVNKNLVEVTAGLTEGDEIVVAGNYNLYDKATIKVVN